jgi:hypothetical protein
MPRDGSYFLVKRKRLITSSTASSGLEFPKTYDDAPVGDAATIKVLLNADTAAVGEASVLGSR